MAFLIEFRRHSTGERFVECYGLSRTWSLYDRPCGDHSVKIGWHETRAKLGWHVRDGRLPVCPEHVREGDVPMEENGT